MKYLLVFTCLFYSCTVTNYQLFETSYENDLKPATDGINYENEDAIVTYNFWSDHGSMFFKFYNKGTKTIYISTEESYFIKNGQAFSYYQTEVTRKEIRSATVADINKYGTVHSYNEESQKMPTEIPVPPNSFAIVGFKQIKDYLYVDCTLDKYPDNKGSSASFSEDNTPLFFRNYITYSMSRDFNSPKNIDNKFWVKRIENMKSSKFSERHYEKDCRGSYKTFYTYDYQKPENFYISYSSVK